MGGFKLRASCRGLALTLLLSAACQNEPVAVTQSAPAAPAPATSAVPFGDEKIDLAHLRQTTRAGPSVLPAPAPVRALAVGNGWGCAALSVGVRDNVMQCWTLDARDSDQNKSLEAKLVQWLPASAFAAGDRLCARQDGQDRCWPALEFLSARPASVPELWTWSIKQSLMQAPRVQVVSVSGDFFQCEFGERAQCWGQSRDGFFGTAGACPKELKRAWPGERGPVAAPKARCADAPTPVPGLAHVRRISSWSAGPRGLCATDQNGVSRCVGAIPQPPSGMTWIAVGTGDEPNACGVVNEGVVCWGGRYSAASSTNGFVRIALAQPVPSGAPVLDSGGRAAQDCQIHRPCPRPFKSLATCPSGERAPPWSDVARAGERWRGKKIRLTGRLFAGAGGIAMGACGSLDPDASSAGAPPPCCNSSFFPIVLVSNGRVIRVEGFDCQGDESRACCNLAASGEQVIGMGTLEHAEREPLGWVLRNPELCLLSE
jgi:hypothetical protein